MREPVLKEAFTFFPFMSVSVYAPFVHVRKQLSLPLSLAHTLWMDCGAEKCVSLHINQPTIMVVICFAGYSVVCN